MRELVRINNTDIHGKNGVYLGLTRIHGVSYSFSNAVCNLLSIDKNKKIGDLSEEEVKRIEETIKNPKQIPYFVYNRRKDVDTGENVHLTTSNLKLKVEFDIKKMKRLKTYKGVRHGLGQPVRGQRTKSHFRTGSSVGVMKKAVKAAAAASAKPGKQESKKEKK